MSKLVPAETNDIFGIVPNNDVEVSIKHPGTGKVMGFFISLRAMESDEVQKVGRAIRTKANKLAVRGKAFTADEEEQNSIQIITAAITGWRWGIGDDGKPGSAGGDQLEYNPGNVLRVLKVVPIRNQLDAELGDTAQFFRQS